MARENVLVINSGSSSLKASLFQIITNKKLERAADINIQWEKSLSTLAISAVNGIKTISKKKGINQKSAFEAVLQAFIDMKCLNFLPSSLNAIGHRVVHGGGKYISSTLLSPRALRDLEKISYLAPLHNPFCIDAIKRCLSHFPHLPQVAVFDTAFHAHLPEYASTYAIPKDISKKFAIKRYGFHGIAHECVWNTYVKNTHPSSRKSKAIVLHLGSGCSMSAIDKGRSVDTSMGLTPIEGLMMSTRSGDLDPGLIAFLCMHAKKPIDQVMDILNSHSGLLGVSGISSDMKTLLEKEQASDFAALAISIFVYRILKYLGAYIAVLGGVDAILFSGGIGENSANIREKILEKMLWFGIRLDKTKNRKTIGLLPGQMENIHRQDSTVQIYAVGVDENHFIAQETLKITRGIL